MAGLPNARAVTNYTAWLGSVGNVLCKLWDVKSKRCSNTSDGRYVNCVSGYNTDVMQALDTG